MNMQKLQTVAVRIAKEIEMEFGPELKREGAKAKQQVMKAIGRKITLRCGRPRSAVLDQAEALRAKGLGYAQILQTVKPDFWKLPKAEQHLLRESIRRAVQQRRRARKTAALTTPPSISEDN